MRLLIINPNINEPTNLRIRSIADAMLALTDTVEVISAKSGIDFIETVADLDVAAPAVISLIKSRHQDFDAIIIAAFSDPGLMEARNFSLCPVYGISEAAMKIALRYTDRFTIVTLGEALRDCIQLNAEIYGFKDNLASIQILPWAVPEVSNDPFFYRESFTNVCNKAVLTGGVGAVIIGGGPLSGLAESIEDKITIPVLDGVRCAIRLALDYYVG